VAAGFITPLLELRLSSTSDVPSSLSSHLGPQHDHVRLFIVPPVVSAVCMVKVVEVSVGAGSFEAEAGLLLLFSSSLHSLDGLFCLGLPDADLVFAGAVADEVGTDSPFVMLECGL
jgi:hypothetical protein